ncbi:hypothetical protein ACFL3T_02070 [Patescibacteria group bacterium]
MPFDDVAGAVKLFIDPEKKPEGVKTKAEWTKFRGRTIKYLAKHHKEVSKWADAAKGAWNETKGLDKHGKIVDAQKQAYLKDMVAAIRKLASGNLKMAVFESKLKVRTVTLRKKIETHKARLDFNAIRESITNYDFLNSNIGKKMFAQYAEAYVRTPSSKRVPLKTIKSRMKETIKIFFQHKTIQNKLDADIISSDFRVQTKLFSKGERAQVFSMLGHYCNGNISAGEKIFKEFKKQQKFQEKFLKIRNSVEGQGIRLELHQVNRLMAAYESIGIPKSKVTQFILAKVAYLKKLNPKEFAIMAKEMPPKQLLRFIFDHSLMKGGSAEYTKKSMYIEKEYIRNKTNLEKDRNQRASKLKKEIEQLQIYREYDAKDEVDDKILKHQKSIVQQKLKLKSLDSLRIFLDMAKDMTKKYIAKPSTNLKSEDTKANISAMLGYFGQRKFNDTENLNGLKKFSKEHKIPMSPLFSSYQAILAEKELISLDNPSGLFEGEHGDLYREFHNDFYKTGKLETTPSWDKKTNLELIQRKAVNTRNAMSQISMTMQEHEDFFKTVSKSPPENKTIFDIKPVEKQEQVKARLIGYGSMLHLLRKLDSKYLKICQDFKMAAMLNEPKGKTFKEILKKNGNNVRTYRTGKGVGEVVHTHGIKRFDESLGETADTVGKGADIYGEKLKALNIFLNVTQNLSKYENLASSELIQPFVKAELSKPFDEIETKLFSKDGHVNEAVRKVNAIAIVMKNPTTPFTFGYEKAIKLYGEAANHSEKANDFLFAKWVELGKTSLAANQKYKNSPQLRDQIKKNIKVARDKIMKMHNDEKAIYGSGFDTKLSLQRLELKNALDKKVMTEFATSIANVAILTTAVATAMVGGSAFAALGQRLFARVASAGVQQFLVTSTSMAGASAGGAVGSRLAMSAFQATGAIDYGGFKKIWEAKGLAKDFAIGFAMSMSAVYAARGAMSGLTRLAKSPNRFYKGFGKFGLKKIQSIGKFLDPENYIQGKNSTFRDFSRELGQEGFEEGAERTNPYVGWIVSAIGCSKSPHTQLALHGIGATDVGFATEGNNFVYTTANPKQFVQNLAAKFGSKPDQHFSYKIDKNKNVFIYLKTKVRGKDGKVIDKEISAFEVKPAKQSENLTPQAEITRIPNLTKNKKGEYTFKNKEDYQETILELRERGFLAIQNQDGTVSIRKGGVEIKVKLPKGTAIMSEQQIADRRKAERFFVKNKVRIVKYFKNKTIREAFALLVQDCGGSMSKFNKKYGLTKYAKKIPKLLLDIKIIPTQKLGAMGCGPIPEFKSVNQIRGKTNIEWAGSTAQPSPPSSSKPPAIGSPEARAAGTLVQGEPASGGNVDLFPKAQPKAASIKGIKYEPKRAEAPDKMVQIELDKLRVELEKISLHDLAKEISNKELSFMTSTGRQMKSLKQRQKIVKELIQLHGEIQFKADSLRIRSLGAEVKQVTNYSDKSRFTTLQERVAELDRLQQVADEVSDVVGKLRDFGLEKHAGRFGNLSDNSEFPSLDVRLMKGKAFVRALTQLKANGVEFNSENAVDLADLINGTSKDGKDFKQLLIAYVGTEFNPHGKRIRPKLDSMMKENLAKLFEGMSPDQINKLIETGKKRHELTPDDKAILKANPEIANEKMIRAMLKGATEHTDENGRTIRMYKGKQLGEEGGIGVAFETWYVIKPSNKLKEGAYKILIPGNTEAKPQFDYEHFNVGDYSQASQEHGPHPGDAHIAKPVFRTKGFILYEKVSDIKGESHELESKLGTLSDKEFSQVLKGMCKGAISLHVKGMAHNDLKPANVVIGKIKNAEGKLVNTGELIDIGSMTRQSNFGKLDKAGGLTVFQVEIQGNLVEIPFFKGKDGQMYNVGFTALYHNPQLISDSVSGKLPVDAGDKYGVGSTILERLKARGHVTKTKPDDDWDHSYTLNEDAPASAKKLYDLANKLRDVRNHPTEFKPDGSRDPDYISLQNVVDQL